MDRLISQVVIMSECDLENYCYTFFYHCLTLYWKNNKTYFFSSFRMWMNYILCHLNLVSLYLFYMIYAKNGETKKDSLEMNCIIMNFIAYFITKILYNIPLIYGKYFNNKCPGAINCVYLIRSCHSWLLAIVDIFNEDNSLASTFNSVLILMLAWHILYPRS